MWRSQLLAACCRSEVKSFLCDRLTSLVTGCSGEAGSRIIQERHRGNKQTVASSDNPLRSRKQNLFLQVCECHTLELHTFTLMHDVLVVTTYTCERVRVLDLWGSPTCVLLVAHSQLCFSLCACFVCVCSCAHVCSRPLCCSI